MSENATVETPAIQPEEPQTPAADPEHEAAVARGDVFVPAGEEAIDPTVLAEIAGEVKAEVETPPAPEVKKEEGSIPRPRFNEVIEENRRLREQLEAAKPTAPAMPEQPAQPIEDPREKIRELRRQQEDLRLEGDMEGANAIGDLIDDLILQTATTQAEVRLKQSTSLTKTAESMEAVAAVAYSKYPFLDVNSPDVDEDAVSAVITRRNELVTGGKSLVEALQMAVDEKGPKFARLLGATPPPVTSKGDEVRAERDRIALEKAAETSVLQPATLPSRSENNSFEVNVNDLTPAQAAKLPEDQKARLRGDVV